MVHNRFFVIDFFFRKFHENDIVFFKKNRFDALMSNFSLTLFFVFDETISFP